MIPFEVVNEHRVALDRLTNLAGQNAARVVEEVSNQDVETAAAALRAATPIIVDEYGLVATGLAESFFVDLRTASATDNIVDLVSADYATTQLVEAAVGYTVATSVTNGFEQAASALAGAVQRIVAGFDRESIKANSGAHRVKYRRVAGPGACAFCAFAASTADVQSTNADIDAYHDRCNCSVVPLFDEIDTPAYYETYSDAASTATAQIRRDYDEKYSAWRAENPSGKRRQFFAKYPETAVTTRNILAGMRAQGFR